MANKYWYVPNNGNGTWGNNGANWYVGTGGSGGPAGNPGPADVAIFDGNSGSGVCTVAAGRTCYSLVMTGFTGTITGSPTAELYVYGTAITLSAAGVFDPVNNPRLIVYGGNSVTCTITPNGQTIGDLRVDNNGSAILAGDLICQNNALLELNSGTFNANGYNVTIGGFTDLNSVASKTLTMGTGRWTLGQAGPVDAGEYVWNVQQPTYMTLNAGTALIKILRYRGAAGLATAIASSGSVSTIVLRDIITATSGGVNSSNWPTSGTVYIDYEAFSYTGISGSTLTGVTRAVFGTGQGGHAGGCAVLCIGPTTTTLSQALGTSDANLYLNDMSILGGAHGYLLVDDEVISFTSRSATSGSGYVSGLTRGITTYGEYHSGNIAHSSGVKVRVVEKSIFTGGGKSYYYLSMGAAGQYMFYQSSDKNVDGADPIPPTISSGGSVGYRLRIEQPIANMNYPPVTGSTITSAPSSINEGSSGTINATVYGRQAGATTYWDIATNAGDFSTSSGSFTTSATSGYNFIDGAPGSFSVTPTADLTTEGAETFTARVRVDSASGTTAVTTSAITINDTSTTSVSYSWATNPGYKLYSEGTTYTVTVNTTGVSNGTTLSWQLGGSFVGEATSASGNFTINSNTGSFTFTATADSTLEGTEYFTYLYVYSAANLGGSIVLTAGFLQIIDSSAGAQYWFSTLPSTVSPGASIAKVSYTPYYNAGTSYPSPGSAAGLTYIGGGGDDDVYYTISLPFNITFYNPNGALVSYNTCYLGSNGYLTFINGYDTTSPTSITDPIFNFYGSDLMTYNVYAGNVGGGRYVIWADGNLYNDNNAYWRYEISFYQNQPYFDFYAELTPFGAGSAMTNDYYNARIAYGYNNPYAITKLYSQNAYRIYPGYHNLPEDSSTARTFTLNTSGVSNGTTLYWSIAHNTTTSADFTATSGTFSISSNSGSFNVYPATDSAVEGYESFYVNIATSSGGTPIANSGLMVIQDMTPSATFSSYGTSMIEWYTTNTITITGSNVPNGTYYCSILDTNGEPFYPNTPLYFFSGRNNSHWYNFSHSNYIPVNIINNSGTISSLFSADLNHGDRQFILVLRRYPITIYGISNITFPSTTGSGNVNLTGCSMYAQPYGGISSSDLFPVGSTFEAFISIYNNGYTNVKFRGTVTSISGNVFYFTLIYISQSLSGTPNSYYTQYGTGWRYGDQFATTSAISVSNSSVTYSTTGLSQSGHFGEGQTATFTITTTGYPAGTGGWWELQYLGNSIYNPDSSDFTATSGTFTLNSSGVASFSITTTADLLTEYPEEFFPIYAYLANDDNNYNTSRQIINYGGYVDDTSTAPEEFLPFFL